MRKPGFHGEAESWLPNRLSFDGPAKDGEDLPSDQNPIQKFMWWDARIDTKNRGKKFSYTVTPVVGTKEEPLLRKNDATTIEVEIPLEVEHDIGTYFNRAVVSSQAFIKACLW